MLVSKAIEFAATKHKGQKRMTSGLPYIIHPMQVMHYISKYKRDSKNWEELQCAALLHDTIEDTDCTYAELEREFTPLVAAIVVELTNDDETIQKIGKNEYLKNKMVRMSKYAFIIKLLDRMSNIETHPKFKYLNDTLSLMEHLKEHRELTKRQLKIIEDIVSICERRIASGVLV